MRITNIKQAETKYPNSYWEGNGYFQNEYDKLWGELVPSSGEANTLHGELLRCIGRLFYDYCNNGNCNAKSDRGKTVSSFYKEFIDFIEENVPNIKPIMSKIKQIIISRNNNNGYFGENNMNWYNKMVDEVMKYILTNNNKPI